MATAGTWLGLPDFGITEKISSALGTHQGSWGLPELGITEKIQNTVSPSSSPTYQGGSNLWGSQPQPANASVLGTQAPQSTPQMQSTGGSGDLIEKYKASGWNNMDAIMADIASGGGSKFNTPSGPSYEDQMRGQIDSGYNSYFSELDNMLGGLDTQRQAQENIANTSFQGNLTDLGLQRSQNLNELGTQEQKAQEGQVKTLKDISSNIRNLMQAGNTYLGSRGAGDSSAVNQYGYALTKLGSQQRGDVMGQTRQIMSDINDRKSRLDNVFMQEKNRLTVEKDNAIQGVDSWFADAQNQLRQAKAQGQLNKSQDLQALTTNLYNQAVQQLTNIQTQTAQRQSQLESWALNNSKSLAEAKANLAGVAQYSAPTQSYSAISGTPQFDQQGNMGVDFRGGVGTGFGLTEDQKRLLGIA